MAEVSAHLHLYLEKFPGESNEQVEDRLRRIIQLACDSYSGLSNQIYDFEHINYE